MRAFTIFQFTLFIPVILLLLYFQGQAAEQPETITDITVQPDYIDIGAFFKGAKLAISAEVPKSDGVVIELEGKVQDLALNRKGRRAFLWLNVAQLMVKNAPSVYILAASDKLDKICSEQELEEELLGYVALRKKIVFESDQELTGQEFDEFIKMKEDNGSYKIDDGVKIDPVINNRQRVRAILDIPSFIPAGDYEIIIYCFRDGNLFTSASANFLIEEVGLTRLTKKLAFGSPAIYGVSAIIIALAAGIIMGLIFSKKSGGAH